MHQDDSLPDGAVRIPLYRRDGSIRAYAFVDDADVDFTNQWRWHVSMQGYAARTERGTGQAIRILMHRELLGLTFGDGLEGDHVNRDRLDNRRLNLRVVNHASNMQNVPRRANPTSSYRGVYKETQTGLWKAQIKANGRQVHLGRFADEHEAGRVAEEARRRLMPFATE